MTLLKFSKTRVVYWEAGRSSLTLPANANTLPDGVTLLADIPSFPYRIARIIGQDPTSITTGHQWHIVPYNYYGLYCTPSEINALYENSNSITPVSLNYVIGHTIPLSRTATASTTQLSFNNTIYSIIVDLPENDHVTAEIEFSNAPTFQNFCRTFDGSRYDNLNRALLPIPPLVFKVPRVKHEGTYWPTPPGSSVPPVTGINYKNFDHQPGLPNGHTQNSAVNAYLPELLQDNTNVKVLYPGENQDMFSLDCSSYKKLATIPTDSINFNETWANLDSRSSLINSNYSWPSEVLSLMSIVPVLRGVDSLFNGSVNTPYAHIESAAGTDAQKLAKVIWSEIIQSKGGMTHDDTFTKGLPLKFIKCLPIMAQDNNVVNHTICGTITWTLEVEVTNRLYKNINPLKWEMLWPIRHAIPTITEGHITGTTVHEGMISSTGLRPLNDAHWRQLQLRRRAITTLVATNEANPNNTDFIPPLPHVNDLNVIPINQEQDISYYSNAAYNDLHTASFGHQTGVQMRRITRSMTRTQKDKAGNA